MSEVSRTEEQTHSGVTSTEQVESAGTRMEEHPVEKTAPSSWPAPPPEEAYHGLAGDIVRAIEPHSEADPAGLLVQFLVGFGNLLGRGPHFLAEADLHFTNLFAVLVGATSKGRKGSSWGHVRRILEAVDPVWASERIQTGLSSGEGLIWAVRDPIEKVEPLREKRKVTSYQNVIVDSGIKDKRLLVMEPELSSTLGVMRREGNILSPVIRSAWDSGELRILTKNSPAQATGAHISIVSHITRDELRRRLDKTDMGNGFANRFLWICVRRSRLLPEGGNLSEASVRPLVERLKEVIGFARGTGEMHRDDQAREDWIKVYTSLSEGRPGLRGAITSRAEAQVMRLACLFALLDRSEMIRRVHLRAALALWEYADASAAFIFGDLLGDPAADHLLRVLRGQPGGLTLTQIHGVFGRNRHATEIGRALGVLQEHGLARCIHEETGGRPAERWVAS